MLYSRIPSFPLFHLCFLSFIPCTHHQNYNMRKFTLVLLLILAISNLTLFPRWGSALQQNYYANICPNVESIVRGAVTQKFQETFNAVGATIRLFFHDCFVEVTIKALFGLIKDCVSLQKCSLSRAIFSKRYDSF